MKMLLARGERVSSQDSKGRQPIHCAAMRGNPDSVSFLLQNGAVIEALEGESNLTPLLTAAQGGNSTCGAFLIHRGASVNALSSQKRTVLEMAIK
jgi:ankyrin repeat protein